METERGTCTRERARDWAVNWLKNLGRQLRTMVGLTGLGVEEVQCARWKMENEDVKRRETGVRTVHAIHPRLEYSCKSGCCEIAIMSSIPSFLSVVEI